MVDLPDGPDSRIAPAGCINGTIRMAGWTVASCGGLASVGTNKAAAYQTLVKITRRRTSKYGQRQHLPEALDKIE